MSSDSEIIDNPITESTQITQHVDVLTHDHISTYVVAYNVLPYQACFCSYITIDCIGDKFVVYNPAGFHVFNTNDIIEGKKIKKCTLCGSKKRIMSVHPTTHSIVEYAWHTDKGMNYEYPLDTLEPKSEIIYHFEKMNCIDMLSTELTSYKVDHPEYKKLVKCPDGKYAICLNDETSIDLLKLGDTESIIVDRFNIPGTNIAFHDICVSNNGKLLISYTKVEIIKNIYIDFMQKYNSYESKLYSYGYYVITYDSHGFRKLTKFVNMTHSINTVRVNFFRSSIATHDQYVFLCPQLWDRRIYVFKCDEIMDAE